MKYNLTEISRYISLILRHRPDAIGITIDQHGWAKVDELIAGINKTQPFDIKMLERIVGEDDKKRYSFNDDKTLIRANQGHSIPVDVELYELTPPRYLYHGTASKYWGSIMATGLKPKSRLYVHLSDDIETAIKVGERHGDPVVLVVEAKCMFDNGYKFYRSTNDVWLTEEVPVEYLK